MWFDPLDNGGRVCANAWLESRPSHPLQHVHFWFRQPLKLSPGMVLCSGVDCWHRDSEIAAVVTIKWGVLQIQIASRQKVVYDDGLASFSLGNINLSCHSVLWSSKQKDMWLWSEWKKSQTNLNRLNKLTCGLHSGPILCFVGHQDLSVSSLVNRNMFWNRKALIHSVSESNFSLGTILAMSPGRMTCLNKLVNTVFTEAEHHTCTRIGRQSISQSTKCLVWSFVRVWISNSNFASRWRMFCL